MDLAQITRILQVALGIGAVIFVHELGHFLAARWCGVRVDLFSLGFGPRLIGWKRGSTTYQLALIPMGGFVKMAGEESRPGEAAGPDELPSKSVGQRFFIYSGGVLMNVFFALAVLPPLLFHGVPFPEPLIGSVAAGGPAWKAGLEPGTRIVAVDGKPVVSFEDLQVQIGIARKQELPLLVRAPGAASDSVVIVRPGYEEGRGIKSIEVGLAADPSGRIHVEPDSPAFAAGLREGDRVIAVDGIKGELAKTLDFKMLRGDPLELEVLRDSPEESPDAEVRAGPSPLTIKLSPVTTVRPAKKKTDLFLGVTPLVCLVRDVRAGEAVSRLGLEPEDRILLVDGHPILREGDFEFALLRSEGRAFEILVERSRSELALSVPELSPALVRQAVRDVAVVGDIEDTRAMVQAGGSAEKFGIHSGDRIVRIGDRTTVRWKDVPLAIQAQASLDRPLDVSVQRRGPDGRRLHLDFEVTLGTFSPPRYGLQLASATYIYRAASFGEAVRTGAMQSWRFMVDTWHTLAGIFRGSVSGDSVGGIILISQASYWYASMGLAKLIFFLCTLSLNLAFINVLPIPVLDGGHLFFLLIEKVKGSPVNERVLGYSQMVGLVLILGLVVFVTFNDIQRLLE